MRGCFRAPRLPPAHGWLAAGALCTALSFIDGPLAAPAAAWALAPCALAAVFAAAAAADVAAEEATAGELRGPPAPPERRLLPVPLLRFAAAFVVSQAVASTYALWGVLQGPGVPPAAGHLALAPLAVCVWAVLALPFLLHVAFARRCAACMPARTHALLARARARTRAAHLLTLFSSAACSFPCSGVTALVLPCAWTGVWTLVGALSPLGAFASPASSQARSKPAALFAVPVGAALV
jgi:hypothetical protein